MTDYNKIQPASCINQGIAGINQFNELQANTRGVPFVEITSEQFYKTKNMETKFGGYAVSQREGMKPQDQIQRKLA